MGLNLTFHLQGYLTICLVVMVEAELIIQPKTKLVLWAQRRCVWFCATVEVSYG